jgi:iron(III) transport system permease protein
MSAKARASTGELALLAGITLIVGAISLTPMLRLALEGVAPGGNLDFAIAQRVLNAPATWRALGRTLDTSISGTVISLVLGGAFALLVALTDIRAKGALVFCFMLPLMIPSQITALAWIQLLGSSSALLKTLGIAPPPGTPHPMLGREGIIALLGLEHAPLVFLALRAGLRVLPREMVEAARAAGAGRTKILRSVVLPLMVPALAAGAMLSFVSSLGNFGTPALLGIPVNYNTLTTLIYQRLAGFGPRVLSEMAVLSLLIGALALAGVLTQNWALARRDYRVIGAPSATLSWRLGAWRPAVEALCWLAIAAVVVVPVLALVASSLVAAAGIELNAATVTLANYAKGLFVQANTSRAFANSFAVAAAGALSVVAIAVPLAYFIAWRRNRFVRLLNLVVEMPYALPGIVLAIACILVFLRPLPIINVSLYGTLWIILVAYIARFLSLGLRPVLSGFAQLDRTLEEAAISAGAGFMFRLRTVILPLMAPVAVAGALLVFLTALNELTVSALLWSSGSETLGVIVFSLQEGGDSPLAAAIAVISIAAIIVLMSLATTLASRLPDGVLPWAK